MNMSAMRKEADIENENGEFEKDKVLDANWTTKYRAVAATANFLAADRPDVAYATKELARRMSEPRQGDWARAQRLARYLRGKPRLVTKFDYQGVPGEIQGFSDTDWAGCRVARRSTSGGSAGVRQPRVEVWSRTQALIALSSAEAELYGAVKTATEILGISFIF